MCPAWFVFSVALICIGEYAGGNLIRGKNNEGGFVSKDVPIRRETIDTNDLSIPVDALVDPLFETSTKRCVEIGEFCMNHSDCCTNACLGYLKKCVSGSG